MPSDRREWDCNARLAQCECVFCTKGGRLVVNERIAKKTGIRKLQEMPFCRIVFFGLMQMIIVNIVSNKVLIGFCLWHVELYGLIVRYGSVFI